MPALDAHLAGPRLIGLSLTLKVIGTLLLIAGTIVGYRRYLKGRVFAERLKLILTSHPIRWLSQDENSAAPLHAVDVEAENIGALTGWEPRLTIKVMRLEKDEPVTRSLQIEEISGPVPRHGLTGIEPGETVVYHSPFCVNQDVPVFRTAVEIRTSRSVWHRALTLPNAFSPDKETPTGTP